MKKFFLKMVALLSMYLILDYVIFISIFLPGFLPWVGYKTLTTIIELILVLCMFPNFVMKLKNMFVEIFNEVQDDLGA